MSVLLHLPGKLDVQTKNAQTKEASNLFMFQKLKQSIEDEVAYDKKEPVEVKAGIAASSEQRAATEDDLEVTS